MVDTARRGKSCPASRRRPNLRYSAIDLGRQAASVVSGSHLGSSPVQVLICDDDWRLRRLYGRHFKWAGAEVIEASDGRQCIDLARSENPDLIVLDLFMPKSGGLSTLPYLRELCDIPVLVVTAYAAGEVFDRSRKLGATACFTKPGFLAQIPEIVEEYSSASL